MNNELKRQLSTIETHINQCSVLKTIFENRINLRDELYNIPADMSNEEIETAKELIDLYFQLKEITQKIQ